MNLNRAIHISTEAHKEQEDKVGKPYITHAMRVMERCKTNDEKIVAVLHDVVEDCSEQGWTLSRLQEEGFSPNILQAVQAISQNEGEPKADYIGRVKKNPLATRVKLNDLEDNMDIRRLPQITEKFVRRLNGYLKTYRYLLDEISFDEYIKEDEKFPQALEQG